MASDDCIEPNIAFNEPKSPIFYNVGGHGVVFKTLGLVDAVTC